jgi:hypothetical protein
MNNKLKELIEENEESFFQDEDINNISFELSNVNDMEDLLDNFSNKSDEKIGLDFESTTNEEGIQIIDEFLKESTKQILSDKKTFDKDVVKMSEEYYNDLVDNLNTNLIRNNTNKNVNENFIRMDSINSNSINLIAEKEKNFSNKKSFLDKRVSNYYSENFNTSDDNNTPNFKKELYDNRTQSFGKLLSLGTKNKTSTNYMTEEFDDNKIIQMKKKNPDE